MSKVQMLNGATTPEVFCANLMELSGDVSNIACVVEYKDGKTCVFHTPMSNMIITWLRWVFDREFVPELD